MSVIVCTKLGTKYTVKYVFYIDHLTFSTEKQQETVG